MKQHYVITSVEHAMRLFPKRTGTLAAVDGFMQRNSGAVLVILDSRGYEVRRLENGSDVMEVRK